MIQKYTVRYRYKSSQSLADFPSREVVVEAYSAADAVDGVAKLDEAGNPLIGYAKIYGNDKLFKLLEEIMQ